jgi:hypothetical protein
MSTVVGGSTNMATGVCSYCNIILNFVVVGPEQLALWVGVLTLVPLALLMLSGLYLFVLPYTARWRAGEAQREVDGR